MIDRPLPKTGQWYIRKNRDNKSARLAEHPTDIVQIGEIDAAKEKIETRRFDGYDGSKPIFGRITSVSFETWHKEGRYTETHEPVPAMLDRDETLRILRALGFGHPEGLLVNPQASLAGFLADDVPDDAVSMMALRAHVAYLDAHSPAVTPPDGMPFTEETLTDEEAKKRLRIAGYSAEDASALVDFPDATRKWLANNPDVPATLILRAYVRGLDAKIASLSGAKIVNLLDGPEHNDVPAAQPTIADVLAAIEALRAEVRADRKPLLDAVDRVLGNHGPYGSESDAVEVHLDAFKALRDARAKV